jgi:transposase
MLAITPLFLKDDNRIRGLVLLLGIALRALTLTGFIFDEREQGRGVE